jgi:ubiquinone/menaquinone biosynthesis C-methylase UbiE
MDRGKTPIEKALRQDGYDGLLTMVREPAEHTPSIKSETFDFVQPHATLEHVMDISAAVAEMARVTRPYGFHSHQVDFRDHRYYDDQPLSHLLFDRTSCGQFRAETKRLVGNRATRTGAYRDVLSAFLDMEIRDD